MPGLALSKCGNDSDDAATTELVADTAVVTEAAVPVVEAVPTEAAPVTEVAVVATEASAPVTEASAPVTEAVAPATEAAVVTEPAVTETTVVAEVNAAGDATPEDLTVYFDTSKSNVRSDQGSKITNAVAVLKGLAAGSKVNVVGHADNRGDAARNLALSEARAATVLEALKAGLGADASKIEFASAAKGDGEPVADLAKSRRVTVEIRSNARAGRRLVCASRRGPKSVAVAPDRPDLRPRRPIWGRDVRRL